VDFILVAVPLVLMTLSVLSISLNGFAKNVAQDIAVDAARYASLADQGASSASNRAYTGLGLLLVQGFAPEVQVTRALTGSECKYSVQVTLKPLALGLLSGIPPIEESASAVCEIQ
jgi:hypothetical protein